ncbi:peptidase inhibitor family I36 protein [Streptomyces sp. NPDC059447]|uniref:peptidase inhibitor family I36 protein n=1 Tax=Streptomyces sp. NPDC059447 TaxID=3346834 RepID=UPI0036C835B5
MNMKRTLALLAATAGITLGMAAPASAYDCQKGFFCFYYNSNLGGSHWMTADNRPNLAGEVFSTWAAGEGQPVKNNSASVWNNAGYCYRVYFNSNYSGPYDTIQGYTSRNLVNTYNDNASVRSIIC